MKSFFLCLSFLGTLIFQPISTLAQDIYDIAIIGGLVMDPETGLNDIRNVGIDNGKIVEISKEDFKGKQVIDASGLIVAPGFIDLHVHGMTPRAHEFQVHDGVTTSLELEAGKPFLREWLDSKKGKSIVNYGASVAHGDIRARAMDQYEHYFEAAEKIINEEGFESPKLMKLMINLGRAGVQQLGSAEIKKMSQLIKDDLNDGALGIGVPVGYYPGASRNEIFQVYRLSSAMHAPIFSHTRGIGMPGIHEAISNATTTGAPLHIVHANSLSLGDIQVTLDMVSSAQERGLDITTEIYPYTAASTTIESAIFDGDWEGELGISYGDIQLESTGERLTEESYKLHREKGGMVIIHMMKAEWILKGIKDNQTIIASDGVPYAPGAHPRSAGTFSRVLGKYVREESELSLMQALKKMTLLPAQRMEIIAPMMRSKGRIQVGVDADITIFNPNTIIDKATFKKLEFSEGIQHVLVNGKLVIEDSKIIDGVFPGKAIVGKYRN